eukprot:588478-Rhodomonas_salina.1
MVEGERERPGMGPRAVRCTAGRWAGVKCGRGGCRGSRDRGGTVATGAGAGGGRRGRGPVPAAPEPRDRTRQQPPPPHRRNPPGRPTWRAPHSVGAAGSMTRNRRACLVWRVGSGSTLLVFLPSCCVMSGTDLGDAVPRRLTRSLDAVSDRLFACARAVR